MRAQIILKATFLASLVGTLALAPVQVSYASIPNSQKSISLVNVEEVHPLTKEFINQELFVTYFPTNLTPTTNQSLFESQIEGGIEQRLADHILQGDFFKSSTLGKIATDINKTTSQSLTFGALSPNGTPAHKLNLQVRAFERKAVVHYEGKVDSNLVYDNNNNTMNLSISKPVAQNTVLAITHVSSMDQNTVTDNLTITYSF